MVTCWFILFDNLFYFNNSWLLEEGNLDQINICLISFENMMKLEEINNRLYYWKLTLTFAH